MNVDNFNFDYLSANLDIPQIRSFRYAVGDTPQPILGTGGEYRSVLPFFARLFVAIHTNSNNGLRKGDIIKINVTNADSTATKALFDKSYNVELVRDSGFIIDLLWEKGMEIQGTWQLASAAANNPVIPVLGGTCGANSHMVNGFCVENTPVVTPVVPSQLQSLLPAWAGYVALGVGVLGLGWILLKKFKHK